MNDKIQFLIDNWDKISKIGTPLWKKIKSMFAKGDKSLGFIKRKSTFMDLYDLSQNSFIKKYSKYILPSIYRGYLLESIKIADLYQKRKKALADKKRKELHIVNPVALRIYNLYNEGILNMVFGLIDDELSQGKSDEEIIGSASKLLDDLINDKSILYVNSFKSRDILYREITIQLKKKKYCIVFGSGKEVVLNIKYVQNQIIDDPFMEEYTLKQNKKVIGKIVHYNLLIVENTPLKIK